MHVVFAQFNTGRRREPFNRIRIRTHRLWPARISQVVPEIFTRALLTDGAHPRVDAGAKSNRYATLTKNPTSLGNSRHFRNTGIIADARLHAGLYIL